MATAIQPYIISSLRDVLDFTANASLNNFEFDDIYISPSYGIKIKLQGKSWDGLVDVSIANYVIKLQKDIFNVYFNATGKKIDLRSKREYIDSIGLKVNIQPGCTQIFVSIRKILDRLEKIMSGMTGKEKIALILGLSFIGAVGINFWHLQSMVKEKEVEVALIAEHEESVRALRDVALESLKGAAKSQEATRYLLSQLAQEDKLEIGDKIIVKDRFESSWPKPAEREDVFSDTYYVDDKYKLIVLDNKNLEVDLVSVFGGKPFRASFKLLSPADKKNIYANAGDAAALSELSSLDLQVSAEIYEGEIKDASIIGLGDKRDGSVSVQEAKENSKNIPLNMKEQQADLLDLLK